MTRRTLVLFVATLLLSVLQHAAAQNNRILTTDDWTYIYIERLQRRGLLLDLDPTTIPYTSGAVRRALNRIDRSELDETEMRWVDLLRQEIDNVRENRNEWVLGGSFEAGLQATNNDRLDPLRPTNAGNPTLQAGAVRFFPYATPKLYMEKGRVIVQAGLRHDFFYDTDPDALDAANRLYVRSEDTYAGYNSRFVSLYLGRFKNHWGTPRGSGVLISDNPLSYDQFTLRIGGDRLALYSLIGELDSSLDGAFPGRIEFLPPEDRARAERRYLAAHRLNWRPTRTFQLSLMESALYSGPGTGVSLKYLIPFHVYAFEVDNTPKNDENNGLLAGLIWAYLKPFTITGQILIDDLDLMGENGEPGSVAFTGSLVWGGIHPTLDAGAMLEVVAARTYNTHLPEGRYLYLLRGLATQFNDYVHVAAFADMYLDSAIPGLTVSPRVDLLWQGSSDIRDPFPEEDDSVDFILNGPVERTIRPALRIRYQPGPQFWAGFDYGINFITHESSDGVDIHPVGLFTVGTRFSFARPYRLSFR